MPTEHEVVENGSSSIPPGSDPDPGRRGGESGSDPCNDNTRLEIAIDRDLAVQLVGSDAGKERRMRPHGAMTDGSTDVEMADVLAVMAPFLGDEIRRVHEDKTHRPRLFLARATPAQAASLKAFCLRFAVSLELNLEKHPDDDNRHRSRQRLDQARRVIAQANAALGILHDDGRTLEQCHREAASKAESLNAALAALKAHAEAGTDRAIAPLLELQEAVRGCLGLCERP